MVMLGPALGLCNERAIEAQIKLIVSHCPIIRKQSFIKITCGFDYDVAPVGRRTVNTDPLPGSLFTVTSPPIMRASLREQGKSRRRR
jgi:hypothetical protein